MRALRGCSCTRAPALTVPGSLARSLSLVRQSHSLVLNGIAYHPNSGRLYVTGKQWDKMYQVRVKEGAPEQQEVAIRPHRTASHTLRIVKRHLRTHAPALELTSRSDDGHSAVVQGEERVRGLRRGEGRRRRS